LVKHHQNHQFSKETDDLELGKEQSMRNKVKCTANIIINDTSLTVNIDERDNKMGISYKIGDNSLAFTKTIMEKDLIQSGNIAMKEKSKLSGRMI
jgi:hypothetical protein